MQVILLAFFYFNCIVVLRLRQEMSAICQKIGHL